MELHRCIIQKWEGNPLFLLQKQHRIKLIIKKTKGKERLVKVHGMHACMHVTLVS